MGGAVARHAALPVVQDASLLVLARVELLLEVNLEPGLAGALLQRFRFELADTPLLDFGPHDMAEVQVDLVRGLGDEGCVLALDHTLQLLEPGEDRLGLLALDLRPIATIDD